MGIYIMLFVLAALGFLPLIIILYKKRRVEKILSNGSAAMASVYEVRTSVRPSYDTVYYVFINHYQGVQYSGSLMTAVGRYKKGDQIRISYMPHNPKMNTMNGSWKSGSYLVFGLAIALFVLFMVYKIYQEVQLNGI